MLKVIVEKPKISNQLLDEKRKQAFAAGGADRIQKQHSRGKATARERLLSLLDTDSFIENGMFVTSRAPGVAKDAGAPLGDGVVTGFGKIDGRSVYIYAQDFTVLGGSLGEAHGRKIASTIDKAIQNGVPIIGLNDSGGARIQEGVDALAAYGDVFYNNVKASGVVPQISLIMGPCAGGAVYSPAITDFIFMVDDIASMFITGPQVIQAVTHEHVDVETLGGSNVHRSRSGVAHFTAANEDDAFSLLHWLLSYLPSNNLTPPPYIPLGDDPQRETSQLKDIIPHNPQTPYDVHLVIEI
ncbi:MAG: carboxyl transferase domain-containing protein, partial [Anaerolineae bacterium]|nr:carboxyl transferase domain-containing protein [Anaerolineae bacterium]